MAGNTSYIGNNGKKQAGILLGGALGAIASSVANGFKNSSAANSYTTNNSTSGNRDIGTEINSAINQGKGYEYVQDLLNQRNDKINSNPGFSQYANDWVNQSAQNYINSQKQLEESRNYYADIEARQAAAKRGEVDRAVGNLSGQKEGINQSYSDLFRQLYVDKMNSQKNLPQQMASMGYTGGLSESALLDLQNSYANSLRQGEQGRLSSLSDIDRAITDTRLQGDISIAEQAAQLAQQGLLSYQDILRSQQEQKNLDRQFGYTQGRDVVGDNRYNAEWKYETSQSDRQTAAEEARWYYLQTGDASRLKSLGYSDSEVQSLKNAYMQQNAPRSVGYSSGGSGGRSGSGNAGEKSGTSPDERLAPMQQGLDDIYQRNIAGGNSSGAISYITQKLSEWVQNGLTPQDAQKLASKYGIKLSFD